jgi:PAS domain-containing protein
MNVTTRRGLCKHFVTLRRQRRPQGFPKTLGVLRPLPGGTGFVIVNAVFAVFDLKLTLFILLLLAVGGGYLAVYLDRRRWRDPLLHQSGWSPEAWRAALDAAPFGLALFDGRHDPLYANQAARRLQETADNEPPAFLPQLRADLAALRQSAAPSSHYRTLNLPAEQSLSWWICAAPNQTSMMRATAVCFVLLVCSIIHPHIWPQISQAIASRRQKESWRWLSTSLEKGKRCR